MAGTSADGSGPEAGGADPAQGDGGTVAAVANGTEGTDGYAAEGDDSSEEGSDRWAVRPPLLRGPLEPAAARPAAAGWRRRACQRRPALLPRLLRALGL